jgi:hypothetical protein
MAWRLIGPPKEVTFVPCEQGFKLGNLFFYIGYALRNHRKADSLGKLVVVLLRIFELALDSTHECLLLLRVWCDIFALKSFNLLCNSVD